MQRCSAILPRACQKEMAVSSISGLHRLPKSRACLRTAYHTFLVLCVVQVKPPPE
jgi:hypothetical protein